MAFAGDVTALTKTGATYYDSLVNYFAQAKQPTQGEVEGWWSGRCYGLKSKETAEPGLFIATKLVIPPPGASDNGPLFPPPPPTGQFNVVIGKSLADERPSAFDEMTPELYMSVRDFVNGSYFKGLPAATYEDGSLVGGMPSGISKYVFRKYNEYVMGQIVVLKDHDSYKAGDIMAACYFFKKLNR